MRCLPLLLLLAALGACAPDDQRFDTSALTPQHQALFQRAADDLNAAYPHLADFSTGSDGWSVARYGFPAHGKGNASWSCDWDGCTIVFDFGAAALMKSPDAFYNVCRHELCHMLGFKHLPGNSSVQIC